MIDSEFLSPDELRELTEKGRRDDQAKALESKGLPFRRGLNKLIVSRHHVRLWLCGKPLTQEREPDFSNVR